MDRLEEHIKKNREDLDVYTPSPEIWDEITKSIHAGKSNKIRWFSAAAMIVVIFTTAALFYVGENRKKAALQSRDEALIMKANPQLQETEIYYNSQVNLLYSEAKPLLSGHPDIKKELLSDMSQIDSLCADIKNDLKDNVANQEVIEALINNYRIKIKILEDMLVLLKQNENDHPKNDTHAL